MRLASELERMVARKWAEVFGKGGVAEAMGTGGRTRIRVRPALFVGDAGAVAGAGVPPPLATTVAALRVSRECKDKAAVVVKAAAAELGVAWRVVAVTGSDSLAERKLRKVGLRLPTP